MHDKEIIGKAIDEYRYVLHEIDGVGTFNDFLNNYIDERTEIMCNDGKEFVEFYLEALNVKIYNIDRKATLCNYFNVYDYDEFNDDNEDTRIILENVTYDEAVKIYENM